MKNLPPNKSVEQLGPPEPIDEIDGVPDRSPHPAVWKYLLLAGAFLAWMAFLLYCQFGGGPQN